MSRLVYLPPAKSDAMSAAKWFESMRPGLGRRFIDHLDQIGDRLVLFLKSGSPLRGSAYQCRRVILGRFDYTLVYRLLAEAGDNNHENHAPHDNHDPNHGDHASLVIEVVAVLHCRLEPRRQVEHIASAIRMTTDIELP